jgi:NTP pyrophosphatase (non-canonical NTP hydrolase)
LKTRSSDSSSSTTQEFADVNIYLDILSAQIGIDLGEAVMLTFNVKSVKVGSRVRLAADDWHLVELV